MLIKEAAGMMTGEAFNSATFKDSGNGQFVGNIGELAFRDWLLSFLNESEFEYVAKDKRFYDFILCGLKFDVKSKERTVVAKPHYHCMVETRIKNEDCHYYLFVSVKVPELGVKSAERVQLLGYLPKREFWALPRDEDGKPDRFSCHKVTHSRLRSMDDLKYNLELLAYKIAFGEVGGAA